jgi:hypothetical protein
MRFFAQLGLALSLVALLCLGSGCRNVERSTSMAQASASSPSAAAPLDRLAPGELAESSELAFGFPVPVGMSVERVFPDAIYLSGEVAVPGLLSYLRKHAQVSNAELDDSTVRFRSVRIPRNGLERQYGFDVVQQGRQVRLVIRDTTPAPLQPGLTEEERWKQAGLKPNGQPLSVTDLR